METQIRIAKIFNNDYPNLLDKVNLSSKDIEEQVAALEYKIYHYRDREAELNCPIFVHPFYDIIEYVGNIPSQETFWAVYLISQKDSGFNFSEKGEAYKKGLHARITSRAYPSLIREFHFAVMLKETLYPKEYIVFYNAILDFDNGIDVLVYNIKEKRYLSICLFVSSRYSEMQLIRKKNKRDSNIDHIEVRKSLEQSQEGIQLYTKEDLMKVVRLIYQIFGTCRDNKSISSLITKRPYFKLFNEGLSVQEIADRNNIKTASVYKHLIKKVEEGKVDYHRLMNDPDFKMSEKRFNMLKDYLHDKDMTLLKPIMQGANFQVDYWELELLRAYMRMTSSPI